VGLSHGILVIAHPALGPTRDDWEQLCRALRAQNATARGQLVVSLGGAPDAAQRKRALAELPKGFVPRPVAVVTESLAVRGIITALNWVLNDNHRSFAPNDAAGVAEHLQVSRAEADALIAFANSLLPR
jgi:hypothetical protein